DLIDFEIAQERLSVVERRRRLQLRVEGAELVGRCAPIAVPAGAVVAAPREQLAEAEAGRELPVGDLLLAARQDAVDRLILVVAGHARSELRRPERARLRDTNVLNLRLDPLNLNSQVLLQRK